MSVIVPSYVENADLLKSNFTPYANIRLKQSNPFVRGLIVCCVPQTGDGLKTLNLVDGKLPVSSTGSALIKATPTGKEIAGTLAGIAYDVSNLLPTPLVFTLFCLAKRTTDPNASMSMMGLASSSSTTDRLKVGVRGSAAGDPYNVFYRSNGASYTLRPGATNANEYIPIAVTRYAPDNLVVNFDGGSLNSANATFGAGFSIADIVVDSVAFMSLYEGLNWISDTDISLKIGSLWNRALSQAEILEFFSNSTQILEFS